MICQIKTLHKMKNQYTKDYYNSLNYINYLDREEKYKKHAIELDTLFNTLSLLNTQNTILDYGCAVGFLIEGFKSLGYKDISGYDISKWATNQCREKGINMLEDEEIRPFDLITALDVLEHMKDKDIKEAFTRFKSNILLVRIPCSVNGTNFHLEISRKDPTHINCKTKRDWKEFLKTLGYNFFFPININTIYDSDGVMCYICFKESII